LASVQHTRYAASRHKQGATHSRIETRSVKWIVW
jgi:hypothetical protein